MDKMIEQALVVLREGGLIVFPTDTVYGLLCDATNKKAIQKLLEFKKRPAGKPISVFVADFVMMKEVVSIDQQTERRLRDLLPGPFTIVLPSRHSVDERLESEKGALGVRIPNYVPILELVKRFGKPVTATSANTSSQPPHYSISSLKKQLSKQRLSLLDYIADGGTLPHNKPSTVVDFTTGDLKVLRQGDLKISTIKSQISNSENQTKQIAKDVIAKVTKQKFSSPILIILKGDLGAGKTIFVKGVGEALGVTETIISPTFVVYYEYIFNKNNYLIHVDLYNVQDTEEFEHLGLEKYVIPGNVMCVEWGDKAGGMINTLKRKNKNLEIIFIDIHHKNERSREITISY